MRQATWIVVIVVAQAAFAIVPTGKADSTVLSECQLPLPNDATGAAWFDGRAYVFGGIMQRIWYFEPPGCLSATATNLPFSIEYPAVVTAGSKIFVLGGYGPTLGRPLDEIFQYDPVTDSLTLVPIRLPNRTYGAGAFWDGQYIYLLGGHVGGVPQPTILRYDPDTSTVVTLSSTLPEGNDFGATVWDGQYAYMLGGQDAIGPVATIIRFEPSSGAVERLSSHLPSGRRHISGVWTGTEALVFGGNGTGSHLWDVLRFDPSTGLVSLTNDRLPRAVDLTSAVWGDGVAYVIGGNDAYQRLRDIVVYDPANQALDPVGNLSAKTGSGRGEVSLSWQEPLRHNHAITGYHIFRGSSPDAMTLLADIGTTLSYRDKDLGDGESNYYEVRAVTLEGTGPGTTVHGVAPVRPSEPWNLTATPVAFGQGPALASTSISQITLSWAAPNATGGVGLLGYRIYRIGGDGNEILIGSVGPSITTYNTSLIATNSNAGAISFDLTFTPDNVFYHHVRARNVVGLSEASNDACGEPGMPASSRELFPFVKCP